MSRRHLPAEDGDRVWVRCSNRDGGVSAVEHRQVVMDCDEHTSRNTFEIWPVVSSYMRKRFEHWSAHAKLGHNAVSSTAMFVAKTCLLNTCKAIEMKQAGTCWRNRVATSNPCCLKLIAPSSGASEPLRTAKKRKEQACTAYSRPLQV